jgi:hypothetical protein
MDYTELLPPDEVASLAAGLEVLDPHDKVWREFAALAIAAAAPALRRAERARCAAAVIAESLAETPDNDGDVGYQAAVNHCAAAIRALPEEP